MTRSYFVECFTATDGSFGVVYRFVCRSCDRHGMLVRWLSDAEDDGERHVREAHDERRVVV